MKLYPICLKIRIQRSVALEGAQLILWGKGIMAKQCLPPGFHYQKGTFSQQKTAAVWEVEMGGKGLCGNQERSSSEKELGFYRRGRSSWDTAFSGISLPQTASAAQHAHCSRKSDTTNSSLPALEQSCRYSHATQK